MNDDIDDRAIDAFNIACGTTRKPAALTTPSDMDFNLRTRLRPDVTEDAPMFNLGGSVRQGLTAGATASRSVGNMRSVIKAVEEAAAELVLPSNYESFVSRKGRLAWPIKGRVAHSFGSTRSGSLRWEGWLISASAGDNVKTVHHGRVVFSNYLRGFGLLVIVDHGEGYMTLYAHNQELLKETGDWVQSNEVVSRAGDTGGLNKPALYFEIRKQGKPADPKSWLGKR